MNRITWEEIIKICPRLKLIYKTAQGLKIASKRDSRVCANDLWYGELKEGMSKLVGWDSPYPQLKNSEAYDVAYEKIYEALPDCKNCACM